MSSSDPAPSRRAVLALGAAAAPAALLAATPRARADGDAFAYEVVRSDAGWREMLTETEYEIMRAGGTERPGSSPLAEEARAGGYHCRGCELPLYDGLYKVVLPMGFVFFYNSVPNAILMDVDTYNPYGAGEAGDPYDHLIEVHCRRCGSHLGHILRILDKALHCINGTSMTFRPAEA